MPYNINLTNGTSLIPGGLSDGTIDTSHSSLVLIGKNYANYGQFLNDNFLHMLENFSSQSPPPAPVVGQLWWNPKFNVLQVYTGNPGSGSGIAPGWKISTGATSASHNNPPADVSSLGGDLWYDTTNSQLNVWSGTNWVTVGPVATPATGDSGAVPNLMVDTAGVSHVVIQFKFNGVIYAVVSKDTFSTFASGFATVRAGINFNTTASPTWGLNTQDVNPTNNTLVQRDTNGGINVITANATTVAATTVTATNFSGIFTGNLFGNVTATSVSATGTLSAPAVLASSYQGTLVTAAQPNITTLGTIANLSATGNTVIGGFATYNGLEIATIGGETFASINNTPIGNATPSTGAFTTLSATGATTLNADTVLKGNLTVNGLGANINVASVYANQLGNVGTTLTGTISTAAQPNITTVGTISSGTWQGTLVGATYGGTGSNNGANTIVATTNILLNQNVAANSSPTLRGTNFNSIPNGALTNNSITITAGSGLSGGGTVALGGTVSIAFAGSPVTGVTGTVNEIIVSGPSTSPTLSTPQALHTGANFQVNSLGVGTGASGTTGEIRATNNVIAYYSDDRLKTRLGKIENALDKICSLEGFYYEANETAQALGYVAKREVGLSAQSTQAVAPEITPPAPVDEQYLTIQYERFAPFFVEAIKELRAEINDLKQKLS
jgi:hypothetical protein